VTTFELHANHVMRVQVYEAMDGTLRTVAGDRPVSLALLQANGLAQYWPANKALLAARVRTHAFSLAGEVAA
jgi:hypothetical protein